MEDNAVLPYLYRNPADSEHKESF